MCSMVDHLDTKNLVPFSRRRNGFQLPGVKKTPDEEMLEQVDPNLRPEDEGVIRRYLHYADTLLGGTEQPALTLVPGGGPAKELAGKSQPTAESEFEGFKPDQLDRVRAEGEKRRKEQELRGGDPEAADKKELPPEQNDDDKAA
jgi:hypothetical protein